MSVTYDAAKDAVMERTETAIHTDSVRNPARGRSRSDWQLSELRRLTPKDTVHSARQCGLVIQYETEISLKKDSC